MLTIIENFLHKSYEETDRDQDGYLNFADFAKILSLFEIELLANYPIQRTYATHDINYNAGYTVEELILYVEHSEKLSMFYFPQ